jgi:methylated-DNA-[protein]-cysteine S-methyltransferase
MESPMNHYIKILPTPVGDLCLATTEKSVVALVWKQAELEGMGILTKGKGLSCAFLENAAKQLREYLAGKRKRFELPLEIHGTPFQKRVWDELKKIPYGRTWSYRELARRVGDPRAARAVGSANGKNPICVFIPCHRVVRLSGELGGYTGGLDKKIFLLDLESAGA